MTKTWYKDDYGPTGKGILAAIPIGIAIIFMFMYFIGMPLIYHAEQKNCERFARETGYTTEWKHTGVGTSGCYVLTDDGWINRDNLIGVVEVDGG